MLLLATHSGALGVGAVWDMIQNIDPSGDRQCYPQWGFPISDATICLIEEMHLHHQPSPFNVSVADISWVLSFATNHCGCSSIHHPFHRSAYFSFWRPILYRSVHIISLKKSQLLTGGLLRPLAAQAVWPMQIANDSFYVNLLNHNKSIMNV